VLNRPFLRGLALVALAAFAGLSCGREVTAPEAGWVARGFSFLTEVGPGGRANSVASDLVPVTTARLVLTNAAGAVVINRVVTFGSQDEVELSFDIPLSNPDGDILSLTLAYANAAGDTVFRGGPISVPLVPSRPNQPPPQPPVVPLDYVGPGAEATRVEISVEADTLDSGDSFEYTAIAYDAQSNVVANAPIAWRSLDLALATLATGTNGEGVTLAGRGTARVEAYLLNEDTQSDTVAIEVRPVAASLELVSGNNQTGTVSTMLGQPVVVRVRATDNLPMENVAVTFLAGNGGVAGQSLMFTGVSGEAGSTWTLGTTPGAQSLTASVSGLAGSPVVFSATAEAEPPVGAVLLHHFPLDTDFSATVGTSGATQSGTSFQFGVLDLDADLTYVEFSGQLVPTSGSYSVSFFIRNRTPGSTNATYLSQGTTDPWHFSIGQETPGRYSLFGAYSPAVNVPAADGVFRHVVLTVNTETSRALLYVNGTLTSDEFVAPQPAGGTALRIGRGSGGLGQYWDGQMDELRIYSGVLEASDITSLYNAGMSSHNRFSFTAPPTTTEVGEVISPAVCVTARDLLGRDLTTFSGLVTIGIGGNPGGATLGGTLTANAVNGVACFNDLSLDAPGNNYTLVASASGFILSASSFFNVTSAAASYLVFDTAPSDAPTNTVISPTITVLAYAPGDVFDPTFTGEVTLELASGPGAAVLGGTLTVNAVAGVATFDDIEIDLPGSYTLRAIASGLTDALSPTFTISSAAATQLVFTQSPGAGVVNAALSPPILVEARTAANDLATGFNGNVTIATGANPGGATLGGTLTVAAVNGVATFNDLSLNAVGTGYTLVASSAGLTDGTSSTFIITAAAVTNSWTNASGGSWSVPTNWSQGRIPIATDTVAITLAGTYTVSMDTDVTASRLLLGGASGVQTITGQNRVVTVAGGIEIGSAAIFQMIGGNVNGATGLIHVQGGFYTFATVTNNAPLYIDTTGTLRAHGSNVYGGGNLVTASGFTNDGIVEFQSLGSNFSSTINVISGVLVNSETGSILATMAAGGTATLTASVQNDGLMTVGSTFNLNRVGTTSVNNGTINITTGNLGFATGAASSFINNGDITIASGRSFIFFDGTVDFTAGQVLGADGIVLLNSATLALDPSRFEPNLQASGTGLTFSAPLTIASGDSLRLRAGPFVGASVSVAGSLIVRGLASINQPVSVLTGGQLIVRSSGYNGAATLTASAGLSNAGTIDIVADGASYTTSLDVTGGPLVNAAGGSIRALTGTGGGTRELRAELQNAGTLTLQTGLTLSRADANHSNSGTIDVTGGTFTVTQTGTTPSFVNTGTINVASGRLFTIANGTADLSAGVVNGRDGFFSTTGTPTLSFSNTTLRPRITLAAGTVVPVPVTVAAADTLRLLNGTFAPTALTNAGIIAMEGSAIINTPTFTTNAGSTLLVRGINISGAGAANATVTNGFTNNGSVVMTSTATSYSVTLTVPNGTLVNAASGSISSVVGTGGPRTLAAQLENNGTVVVSQPLNLNRAESDHVNNGLIELLSADLAIVGSGTSPSFVNNDSIHLTAGRTISFSGGTVDLRPGIIAGRDGFFVANGTTTLQFESASLRPRITLAPTVTLPDPFTVPVGDTLRLINGTFAPPSLTNEGVLALEGTATVTTPTLNTATGSTILVRGINVTGAGTANATITNGFTNTATIDLSAASTSYTATLTVPGGPLVNGPTGLLRSVTGTGGTRILALELDNQGTVTVQQPMQLTRTDAAHVNSGLIELTNADLLVTQVGATPSFTNLGSITLAAGRTLTFNAGTIDLLDGVVSGRDGFFTTLGAPTLLFEAADLRPRVTLSAGTVLPNPFTVPAGDTLRLLNGTFAPPALINDGVVAFEGSPVLTTPTLTTNSGSKLLVRGINVTGAGTASATITNGFTNTAEIDLSATSTSYTATLTVPNGNLVNGPTGTITSVIGTGGSRVISAQLDNQGTVNVLQALTLNRADVDYVNSGLIDVQTNNLTITQSGASPSFTNLGTVNLAAGRTFTVADGLIDLEGGVVNGRDAFFVTTGAPTLLFENADLRPRITLSAGTVLPDPFTVPSGDTLRLLNGTFAPPALTNDGVLAFEGAPVLTTPTLTTNAGSKLLLRGINTAGAGTSAASITNGFTNTAEIELTSANTSYSVTLTIPNGTLVNASSGTITTAIGTGGARTISAQLDNQGTINVLQALALNRAEVDYLNSGLIDLQTGNVTVTQSGTSPSFTNLGTVNLAAGRTLTFAGGLVDLDAGVVNGRDAFFVTTGAPTLLFTSASLRPRLTLSATTVIPDPFEVPVGDTLRILNGTFAPPSLLNSGVLSLEGTPTITTPTITTATGSTISVLGSNIAGAGAASATFTNGFANTATIDLLSSSTSYAVTLSVANGTLLNAASGVLRSRVGTGGTRTLAAEFDNQGLLTIEQPLSLARASAAHVNSGTIDLTTGNLTVTQSGTTPSFTNLDSIIVGTGRTITFAGGLVDLDAGVIDGRNGFFVTTGAPTVHLTNAAVRPRITLSATTVLPDPFEVPALDTLRLLNGTFAPPSLLNNGVLALEGAPVITTPTLTTGTGSTILVRGINTAGAGAASATFTNGFTNTAFIDLTSVATSYAVDLIVTNGTLTNASTGFIRSLVGTGGARSLDAQLDNQGTVQVSQALVIDKTEADHVNNGLIELLAGNLTVASGGVSPTFVNNDSIHLADGRTITFFGGDVDLRPGIVFGRNSFFVTTGAPTLRFEAADVRPRLTLSAGTVLPEPFTVPAGDTLRLLNGTFAPPALTNDGVLAMEGSPVINTQSLTTGAGSTLLAIGINTAGAGAVIATFTNGFTNTALIELTATNTGYAAELRVTNGTLTNAASGTVRSSIGTGGGRTLGAQLDNSGTLDLQAPLNLSRASSAHINRVPLNLSTQNLTVTQTGTTPSFTTLDDINIGAGRALVVSGGTFDVSTGSVSGLGTLTLTSGAALAAPSSAPLNAAVSFGTTSSLAAALEIPAGDSLRVIGGTLAGTNALLVNGTLDVIGSTTISAPITTSPSGLVLIHASTTNGAVTLTTPNGWTNTGTVELLTETGTSAAAMNVTNGVFVNAPGATLRTALGSGGARNIGAAIDNQGLFDVQRTTNINRTSSVHSNSGTINVASASTLTYTQSGTTPSFTNTGTVNLAAATSLLTIGGGTTIATSGTVQGLGGVNFTGGSQQLDIAASAFAVPINFGTGSTLVNALTIPVGDTLRVAAGTIAGPGLHVAGTLAVTGATIISAPLTTAAGSEIDILAATLTVPQSWTNNGFLRFSAPTASPVPTLTMTGQTLTVSSSGAIEMPTGAGSNRVLNAALLDNSGTLDIASNFSFPSGTLTQRLNMAVAASRTFTLGTLNLPPGSTTIVNGILTLTTCNNTGGSISGGGTIPASCLP